MKKTLLWFFGVGMVLMFKTQGADKPHYFRGLLRHLFEWTLIIELVAGFYSFSLWIELLIVPFLLLLFGLQTFSKKEDKYKQIHDGTGKLINWTIITVFCISFCQTLSHWHTAINQEHIKDLLFAPVMTLLYLPYLYLLAVYMGYETLLLRLSFWTRNDQQLFLLAKRSLRQACGLNLRKVTYAKGELLGTDPADNDKFEQLLDTIGKK